MRGKLQRDGQKFIYGSQKYCCFVQLISLSNHLTLKHLNFFRVQHKIFFKYTEKSKKAQRNGYRIYLAINPKISLSYIPFLAMILYPVNISSKRIYSGIYIFRDIYPTQVCSYYITWIIIVLPFILQMNDYELLDKRTD